MRVLVWQWGRYGAGPRFALELARALSQICGQETLLSLAQGAELLQDKTLLGAVDLPIYTYAGAREFASRTLAIRWILRPLLERLEAEKPDAAIVTMMGYWDVFLVRKLRRMGVPVVVISHDAAVHPGDRFHLALYLQRHLLRRADGVVTLTDFVRRQIEARVDLAGKVRATIPLAAFGALNLLGELPLSLRVVGAPQTPQDVAALAAIPGVQLDLGWQSDRALISHLDWADVVVLPYVEASQSGVVPMSFKRARAVIATPVGGLPEQVRHGETGLITETVSPQSLAHSIKRLADDRPLVRQLGENAHRHAESELSWRALGPRFAETLEAAMHKRASGT
jgi:hypothetical protein